MNPDAIGILLGAACGAVIGLERQWSGHASGPNPHFAGVRTQTLLGGLASVGGWLWSQGAEGLAAIILIGAVAVIVVAYMAVSRHDTDATTEVAALVVVAAGLLSGTGSWGLASGITVVTAVLLMEKPLLHSWIARIPDTGLRASFRFALMALVILPLLPEGPLRFGVRPRELWMVVLLFSGISFVAYVVRSFVGPKQGYLWAGALGGLISSTNVTLTFSRLSRKDSKSGAPLALGVVAACTLLNFRVLAAAAILNPQLARALIQFVAAPAVVGTLFVWFAFRRSVGPAVTPPEAPSPLQFSSALQMAVLFQVVLFLTGIVHERWGQTGLVVSGALLGFTDVDALVASMAKVNDDSAAVAVGTGIVANTVLKLLLATILGQGLFRKLAMAGLTLLGAATTVSIVIFSGVNLS